MNIPMLDFKKAVTILLDGGLIIYPTETFFAIGCMVTNAQAVQRLFEVKQRHNSLPLPVIGGNRAQLNDIAIIHKDLDPLLNTFWPGPLTLVCPALAHVPASVTANTGNIALRVCSHIVAAFLTDAVGQALISSSANISGNKPVCREEDLDSNLASRVDGILCDGLQPLGGLPSTIIQREDNGSLKILREGAIPLSEIAKLGFSLS